MCPRGAQELWALLWIYVARCDWIIALQGLTSTETIQCVWDGRFYCACCCCRSWGLKISFKTKKDLKPETDVVWMFWEANEQEKKWVCPWLANVQLLCFGSKIWCTFPVQVLTLCMEVCVWFSVHITPDTVTHGPRPGFQVFHHLKTGRHGYCTDLHHVMRLRAFPTRTYISTFTYIAMPFTSLHIFPCFSHLCISFMPFHTFHTFTYLSMPFTPTHTFLCLSHLYIPLHSFHTFTYLSLPFIPLHAFHTFPYLSHFHVPSHAFHTFTYLSMPFTPLHTFHAFTYLTMPLHTLLSLCACDQVLKMAV